MKKNNKLNINFDNEISENPDLQIGKEDGETQVLIDGQPGDGLPVPSLPDDVGKVPTVQNDGSYGLENGGSSLNKFVGYIQNITDTPIRVYKDTSKTQFGYDEAALAVMNADTLELRMISNVNRGRYIVTCVIVNVGEDKDVHVLFNAGESNKSGYLYI